MPLDTFEVFKEFAILPLNSRPKVGMVRPQRVEGSGKDSALCGEMSFQRTIVRPLD
jgi:hypothetical protein